MMSSPIHEQVLYCRYTDVSLLELVGDRCCLRFERNELMITDIIIGNSKKRMQKFRSVGYVIPFPGVQAATTSNRSISRCSG